LSLTELNNLLAPEYLDNDAAFDFRLQLPFISCLLGYSRIRVVSTNDHSRLAQVTARPGHYSITYSVYVFVTLFTQYASYYIVYGGQPGSAEFLT